MKSTTKPINSAAIDVMLFDKSDVQTNYVCRACKNGEEARLVSSYISKMVKTLGQTGKTFAVFVEPLLPTGYPDCVVVEYDSSAYDCESAYLKFSKLDRKTLYILMKSCGMTIAELSLLSGYPEDSLRESLISLRKAGLARNSGGKWHSVKKRNGIRKVVAIEAKLTGWKRAVEQAVVDSTFANESYILMPKATKRAMEYAAQSGVGVYCHNQDRHFVKALAAPLDTNGVLSYIVLYFDEWIRNKLSLDMKKRRKRRVCV